MNTLISQTVLRNNNYTNSNYSILDSIILHRQKLNKRIINGKLEINTQIISFKPLQSFNEIQIYFNNDNNFFRTFKYFFINTDKYDEGSERRAYYGTDKETQEDIVIKEFKNQQYVYERTKIAIEIFLIANYFANQFNSLTYKKSIYFEESKLFNYNNNLYFFESRLDNFKKYNNNSGGESEKHKTLNAFMHFTYKSSNNYLVVCDLQGYSNYDFNLTDAAINSFDKRFGLTDQGQLGITNFLNNHRCNSICKQLNL